MKNEQSPLNRSSSQAGLASFKHLTRPDLAGFTTAKGKDIAQDSATDQGESSSGMITHVPGLSSEAKIIPIPVTEVHHSIDVNVDGEVIPIRRPIITSDQVPKV